MSLDEIRNCIQMDAEGKLSLSNAMQTMGEIESFKKAHHYLPEDIADWYDQMQDWMEEQNEELDAMMAEEESIKEEYLAYMYENLLED